jgi:hypothetical protein
MRRLVNTACLAGIQILLVTLATFAFDLQQPAHAEQIEPADRTVDTMRVTYVERFRFGTLRYVELNDGSTWHLRPCRFEDGRHCYWDAHTRGNHIGRSFIVVRGTTIFTNRI